MDKENIINGLLSNREKLEAFLYTPWREVLPELERRQDNLALSDYLTKNYGDIIPETLQKNRNMALARHVATPNFEVIRFLQCADVITELRPVILEYGQDKYVNINTIKHALAELKFVQKRNMDGSTVLTKKTIIDRNEANGKKLDAITTKTNVSLIEFHHGLFEKVLPDSNVSFVDLSEMYQKLGGRARLYYKGHLVLFLRNNVLFENFLLNKEEYTFLKEVILPAMLDVIEETGHKPLIVNLGPTGNEDDVFWISHPPTAEIHVENLMSNNN